MIDRLVNYFRSLGLVDDSNDKIIKYGLRRVCLFLTDFGNNFIIVVSLRKYMGGDLVRTSVFPITHLCRRLSCIKRNLLFCFIIL